MSRSAVEAILVDGKTPMVVRAAAARALRDCRKRELEERVAQLENALGISSDPTQEGRPMRWNSAGGLDRMLCGYLRLTLDGGD